MLEIAHNIMTSLPRCLLRWVPCFCFPSSPKCSKDAPHWIPLQQRLSDQFLPLTCRASHSTASVAVGSCTSKCANVPVYPEWAFFTKITCICASGTSKGLHLIYLYLCANPPLSSGFLLSRVLLNRAAVVHPLQQLSQLRGPLQAGSCLFPSLSKAN